MRIIIECEKEELPFVVNSLFVKEIPYIIETQNKEEKKQSTEKSNEHRGRRRTVSLEKIKQIKEMAQHHPEWGTIRIAKYLGLTEGQVDWWRKHTPKELAM